MTDEEDGAPRSRPAPPIDGPTVMGPSTGELRGPAPVEPTLPVSSDEQSAEPTPPPAWPHGPAAVVAEDDRTACPVRSDGPAPVAQDDPTIAEPGAPDPAAAPATWPDEPTIATPGPDEPTVAVVDESPTTTGPTVAGWPLDELLPPPPTDLVWRPGTPEPPPAHRRPAYYVALGASVVLVVALIAAAALATVLRPAREVTGTARPGQPIPEITGSGSEPPPPPPPAAGDPLAEAAAHPLSSSDARMADVTCALPRFGLADDQQAAFYAAAKTCADDAWRGVLDEAGVEGGVEVVTVTSPLRTGSCGELTPASPATQCDGTVYMTPAHLRDAEQNGRYPGRYLGVFLREYAGALQFTTGLAELVTGIDDAEDRLAGQATCLAGVASGAMANRGAVDANITGEIRARLSSVDAPLDAKALLDRGFKERTLAACNTWHR